MRKVLILIGTLSLLVGCSQPALYPDKGTADDPIQRIYPYKQRTTCIHNLGVVYCN